MTASQVVMIIGLVLTGLNIIDKIITLKDRASRPQRDIEARLEAVEKKVEAYGEYLSTDKREIETTKRYLDQSTSKMLKAITALIDHAIDGKNTDELAAVSRELNTYLYEKGFGGGTK